MTLQIMIEVVRVLFYGQLGILDLILKILYRTGMQQDMDYVSTLQKNIQHTLTILESYE